MRTPLLLVSVLLAGVGAMLLLGGGSAETSEHGVSDVPSAGREDPRESDHLADLRAANSVEVHGQDAEGEPGRGGGRSQEIRLDFRANTGASGIELWKTDGTDAGTGLVVDLLPGPSSSFARPLIATEEFVLFVGDDGVHGSELWRTDGTPTGTQLVADVAPGTLSIAVTEAILHDGAVYLALFESVDGLAVWRTDGTAAGTVQVCDPDPFNGNSGVSGLTSFAGQVWFSATSPLAGEELWTTDGTVGGAELVVDLFEGVPSSFPEDHTAFGDRLYFHARDLDHGREWRAVDPQGQVSLVGDLRPGPEGSEPGLPVVAEGRLLVVAEPELDRAELFAIDGAPGGLAPVTDFASTNAATTIFQGVRAGKQVFFFVSDGSGGVGLWGTDGTASGTRLLSAELLPGVDLEVETLYPLGSGEQALFRNRHPELGVELWVASAVPGLPTLATDLQPGPGSSSPYGAVRLGARELLVADDGVHGFEPHAIGIANLGGMVAEPYGNGCGTAEIGVDGEVRIGVSFDVTLVAEPLAAAGLFLSADQVFTPLAPDCQALIGSAIALGNTTLDPAGFGAKSMAVAAQPSLIGAHVFLQWASLSIGGPISGLIELSDGLELVVGP